jgi:hypothetical protein
VLAILRVGFKNRRQYRGLFDDQRTASIAAANTDRLFQLLERRIANTLPTFCRSFPWRRQTDNALPAVTRFGDIA